MNLTSRLAAFWKRELLLIKATSFALVGVVNTGIDLAVFVFAYNFLHLALIPANVLAWFVAVSFSYVLNSTITFAAESGRRRQRPPRDQRPVRVQEFRLTFKLCF